MPGGNRPGINSSGAVIKKNGSMGIGGGMGSYANYNQHHHMSSQLQPTGGKQQHSIITGAGVGGFGGSGTISVSHSN